MNEIPAASSAPSELGEAALAYRKLLAATPTLRIRDAAEQIGVSEAELVATNVDAHGVRLREDWPDLIRELPKLGRVMVLTRNDWAVHEKDGAFEDVKASAKFGLVLGPDIDLRILLDHWHIGFAVDKPMKDGSRRSLQFFDRDGAAVHKVFLRDGSDAAAYGELVARFAAPEPNAPLRLEPVPEPDPDGPDEAIDRAGFRAAWEALKDVHDIAAMLREFGLGRRQALRLIGEDYARPVPVDAFRRIVEAAAETRAEIMIFVGSPGCIQIHTGPVETLKTMGPWFNVLDPGFNLHLREDGIAHAWIVRKPTKDGIVTSLEIFDARDKVIAIVFGKRKEGQRESETWRALLSRLTPGEGPA